MDNSKYTYDCRKANENTAIVLNNLRTEKDKSIPLHFSSDVNICPSTVIENRGLMWTKPTWHHKDLGGIMMNSLGYHFDFENDFLQLPEGNADCFWIRFSLPDIPHEMEYPEGISSFPGRFRFLGYDLTTWDGYSEIWNIACSHSRLLDHKLLLNQYGLINDLQQAYQLKNSCSLSNDKDHLPLIIVKMEVLD